MPTYDVEVYELWSQKVRIKAGSPEEAIAKVIRHGEGDYLDNELEFIESAGECGCPIGNSNLTISKENLEEYGVNVADGEWIPALRNIEEVEDEEDDSEEGGEG